MVIGPIGNSLDPELFLQGRLFGGNGLTCVKMHERHYAQIRSKSPSQVINEKAMWVRSHRLSHGCGMPCGKGRERPEGVLLPPTGLKNAADHEAFRRVPVCE